jgi:hypothetical protein
MEKRVIPKNAQQEPYSILMLDMQDDELDFYRRFVRRHGGVLKPGPYRGSAVLSFPPGTQKLSNDPDDPQMQETYRLLYAEGICLTWYRLLILDGQPLSHTLLVPVEDEDWELFEEAESEQEGGDCAGATASRPPGQRAGARSAAGLAGNRRLLDERAGVPIVFPRETRYSTSLTRDSFRHSSYA